MNCDAFGSAPAFTTPLCSATSALARQVRSVATIPPGSSCAAHCEAGGLRCAAACSTDTDDQTPVCACAGVWLEASCSDTSEEDDERLCACTDASTDELRPLLQPNQGARAADPHVLRALDAAADPICTEPLDRGSAVAGAAVLPREAAERLRRCGFVHLRGALAPDELAAAHEKLGRYVRALRANATALLRGLTSLGEAHFVNSLQKRRWELLLPAELATAGLLLSQPALATLAHFAVLGPQLSLHSFGAAIAEPGAQPQRWHRDASPLFAGVSGGELPPHAVTLLAPLHDLTSDDGPTELCVGSHHTYGLGFVHFGYLATDNATLRRWGVAQLTAPGSDGGACEAGGLRVHRPLLRRGDALLFDYRLRHRGGANRSPRHRALLYVTFARPWYVDAGFSPQMKPQLVPGAAAAVASSHDAAAAAAAVSHGSGGSCPAGGVDAGGGAGWKRETSAADRAELKRMSHRARFAEPAWTDGTSPFGGCGGDTTATAEGHVPLEELRAPLLPLTAARAPRTTTPGEAIACTDASAVLNAPWMLQGG